MKRKPTEAQKAKAAARREMFRKLAVEVSSMSDAERAALVNRAGGIFTTEGRPLSMVNSCLVLAQCPGASMVGGFVQWIKTGRVVRKGESGLSIWVPTGGKSVSGPADVSTGGEPIADAADAKANPKTRFIMGTVFDVSQTDAMPAADETDEPEEFVILEDSEELAVA